MPSKNGNNYFINFYMTVKDKSTKNKSHYLSLINKKDSYTKEYYGRLTFEFWHKWIDLKGGDG